MSEWNDVAYGSLYIKLKRNACRLREGDSIASSGPYNYGIAQMTTSLAGRSHILSPISADASYGTGQLAIIVLSCLRSNLAIAASSL